MTQQMESLVLQKKGHGTGRSMIECFADFTSCMNVLGYSVIIAACVSSAAVLAYIWRHAPRKHPDWLTSDIAQTPLRSAWREFRTCPYELDAQLCALLLWVNLVPCTDWWEPTLAFDLQTHGKQLLRHLSAHQSAASVIDATYALLSPAERQKWQPQLDMLLLSAVAERMQPSSWSLATSHRHGDVVA
jgi:hypothetical protein